MYMLKVSYGDYDDVDGPETATVEILGTYESLDEACEEAKSKFDAIMERIGDDLVCFGEVAGSLYDYYVTYGDHDVESGRVVWGYDYYCQVSVVER